MFLQYIQHLHINIVIYSIKVCAVQTVFAACQHFGSLEQKKNSYFFIFSLTCCTSNGLVLFLVNKREVFYVPKTRHSVDRSYSNFCFITLEKVHFQAQIGSCRVFGIKNAVLFLK